MSTGKLSTHPMYLGQLVSLSSLVSFITRCRYTHILTSSVYILQTMSTPLAHQYALNLQSYNTVASLPPWVDHSQLPIPSFTPSHTFPTVNTYPTVDPTVSLAATNKTYNNDGETSRV